MDSFVNTLSQLKDVVELETKLGQMKASGSKDDGPIITTIAELQTLVPFVSFNLLPRWLFHN